MIRYYAYYNHGGYKDLYLGSSEDKIAYRYFLPLLSVYESDESMAEKVAEWKKLPAITILSTETSEYNYPTLARVMMSHAGYKLQYRHFGDKGVLALRDVGNNKDAYGRNCPFVMMMVADTDEDKEILEIVCYYVWKNLSAAETLFSSLFVNDFEVNGLRFDVALLNDNLQNIVSDAVGKLEDNTYNRPVHFFLLPDGMRFATAFEEQQCNKEEVAFAYNLGITSTAKEYKYSPPQVIYGPSGYPPIYTQQPHEMPVNNTEPSFPHHSFRNALGFAKNEDLQALMKSYKKLMERVAQLEQRLNELENKN